MAGTAGRLTETSEWRALAEHQAKMASAHLRDLFAADPQRGERYTTEVGDLFLDYSKQLVDDETLRLLVALAEARGVPALRDAMFRGERVNVTEDRAVLHVALRAERDQRIVTPADGHDVVPDVHEVLDRMATSRSGSARASGRATPASASATS